MILTVILAVGCRAAGAETDFGAGDVPGSLPDAAREAVEGWDTMDAEDLGGGVRSIVEKGFGQSEGSIKASLGLCLSVFAVTVLAAVVRSSGAEQAETAMELAGVLAISMILYGQISGFFTQMTRTVDEMAVFSGALFPAMASAAAASGRIGTSTALLGITTAMEEKNSQQKNMDATAIDNVKASLMGPLAGLGDSFFWGTLRLIATGIGTSLALKGNILGPILFLLVFNVPHILVRWCFTRWGYVLGTGVLQRIQKSGMMESLTYGASIIGLMVVGAMTASMIDITIPLSFGAGEAKTQVQDIINDILPCMLPLVSFGIVYWLLGRKVKPLSIIGGMALVGILGSWIGLF